MHERAPVAMEAAKVVAEFYGAPAPPTEVTVALGVGVDPEIAREAWESATDGTNLSGVPVAWLLSTARLVCLTCGTEYRGAKLDRCPSCKGDGLVVEDPPIARVVSWTTETP